jgi:hypothetical protein
MFKEYMSFFKFLPTAQPKIKKDDKPTPKKRDFVKKVTNQQVIPTQQNRVEQHAQTPVNYEITATSDILYIDHAIRTKLLSITIESITKELTSLQWILMNSKDPADKSIAKSTINTLRQSIPDVDNRFDLMYYCILAQPIIERYKKVRLEKKSFVRDNTRSANVKTRHSLNNEFRHIAKNFIVLQNVTSYINKLTCECGSTDFIQTDEGFNSCCECGAVIEMLDNTPNFKDIDRVNMASRYKYTEEGNFITALSEFTCQQNTTIDQSIFDMVKAQMGEDGIGKDQLSIDNVYEYLEMNGASEHYPNAKLIYYSIKDQIPPDLSPFRTILIDLFRKIEKGDKELKEMARELRTTRKLSRTEYMDIVERYLLLQERTSSRSINYILYKELQLIKFPVKRNDLSFLKTKVKIDEHDEWWGIMCEFLDLEMIPT